MPYIPSARDITSLYPEGMPTIATIATTIEYSSKEWRGQKSVFRPTVALKMLFKWPVGSRTNILWVWLTGENDWYRYYCQLDFQNVLLCDRT